MNIWLLLSGNLETALHVSVETSGCKPQILNHADFYTSKRSIACGSSKCLSFQIARSADLRTKTILASLQLSVQVSRNIALIVFVP